jgi:DNA-binding CsgD family transcriptional regulator
VQISELDDCRRVWVLGRVDRRFTDQDRELCTKLQRICTVVTGRRAATTDAVPAPFGLTRREHSIVVLVAQGDTAEDVANRLGISRRTVDKHLEHAYRKLRIHHRRDVAKMIGLTP